MNTTSINFSQIETLIGLNFKRSKFDIEVAHDMNDIDYAITQDEPTRPVANSPTEVKKKTISEAVFGGVEETKGAKQFMESIERKFKESNKAETKNLMSRLANTKYEGGSVREHLMGLVDIATKLNMLKVPIDPTYLVHNALDSLPYDQMKSTYNTLTEDWTMDDLITIVILENRTQAYSGVVNMVTTKKYENKDVAKWKMASLHDSPASTAHFFKIILDKTSKNSKIKILVKFWVELKKQKFKESNKAKKKNLMSRLANTKYEEGSVREHLMGLVEIATKLNRLKMKSNYNTLKEDWTMDDLITIIILENRTQAYGCVVNMVITKKYENKENSNEVFGGVEETKSAKQFMESIERKFKESNKAETKNLMSRLANTKYEGGSVREHLMGLVDIATKLNRLKVPIDPTYLVHTALDSLPYDKMKSTYNTLKEDWTMDGLITIEFTRWREPRKCEVKVSVRNGKQVDVEAIGVMASQYLKIPMFLLLAFGLYCLNYNKDGEVLVVESSEKRIRKKSQAFEMFKIFQTEVKMQLEKRSKLWSDIEMNIMDVLMKEADVLDLLLGNRILKDMVRNMISKTDLPMHLWVEAIKTANYILNRVPASPCLRHLLKFGLPESVACDIFIYGGFKFDCPNYGTRIVETSCAKFIKHEENTIGNEDFIFEEEWNVAVIENDEQEVTTLIPLSETVLEPPQFEEPVDK
ncbi:hypothetical protein Prudu_012689 [Prunus dulcis]|uniref:Uncharacterized protein n=1 Tax=Prunus dulcis TaxID=3755 RepID=A0A4Y1RD82_PRUDU|nr:hypothetical protein Prudu_012689 [Prunus dulcis]